MSNAIKLSRMLMVGLTVVVIAAMVMVGPAYSQGKSGSRGKPGSEPPLPPPPDSWVAFYDNIGKIYLSDGIDKGLLIQAERCRPSWSADGTELAVFMNGGIHAVKTDGTGDPRLIVPLTTNPATLDWSETTTPTGSEMIIFFDMDVNQVFAVNPDGSNLVQLTFELGETTNYFPVWSPDAAHFAACRWTNDGTFQLFLYEVDLVNGILAVVNATPVTGIPGSPIQDIPYAPDWSHDGNWIVVDASGEFYRINVFNPADVVQLTFPEHRSQRWPCFSADDTKIYFSRYLKGGGGNAFRLHSINALDGSDLLKIFDEKAAEDGIAIRPF